VELLVTRPDRNSSILLVLAMVLTCSSLASGTDENTTWESEGGHLVLIEQYTATWCETCSSVDEWMPDFTRDNSGRIVRVAIHDSVGDPLGTPITPHRIQIHTSAIVTPTFWMDGDLIVGGLPDQTALHQELLSSESTRSDDSRMKLSLTKAHNSTVSLTLSILDGELEEASRVSIFALLDKVELDDSQATNGLNEHRDVVFAYAESSINDSNHWYYPEESWDQLQSTGNEKFPSSPIVITANLSLPEGLELSNLRLVAVHERINPDDGEPLTKGAVELFVGQDEAASGIGLIAPLGVIMVISAFAITNQSRR